jgi:two-component system cell cycle sensor histidine kinase/response regulator CckA
VGKITIETVNFSIDDTYVCTHADCVPGDYVLLAVSDTGEGMDQEIQAHLFEPFFTTKPATEGTGLGLATVYGIVKQNGGLISVYSEPGHGATFKVYLPRTEAPFLAADLVVDTRSLRGDETVLLVEDEGQILNLGKRILQAQGYTVLAALSPEAALELVAQHPGVIHLLVTDIIMPGMNGRELWKRVAALKPGLRCLFTSGYTANVIAHQGILEAEIHFLQKPFTSEILARKIREVLES